MTRTAFWAMTLALAAAGASAQTNDHLFRSWSLSLQAPSPRSAALGRALGPTADDAVAAYTNPAALSTLHKAEILGAGGAQGGRDGHLEDAIGSRLGLAFAGGSLHLSPRLAAGVYVAQPHSTSVRLGAAELPDGLHDDGSIDTVVTELGAAFAWRLSETIHVGARLSARHFSLEGRYSREAQGAVNLRVGTSASTTAPAGAFGVLVRPVAALRLGAAVETGRGWRIQRTATSPVLGQDLAGGEYEVHLPTRYSAGVAWKTGPRLTLFGRIDRVRLGEVQHRLAIAQGAYVRSDFVLDDAWEGGAGAELSVAFRKLSLQMRAGARSRAPNRLAYVGPDAVARAAFPGAPRRTMFGAGAGVFTRGGLHVDVSIEGGEGVSALAGAGLRF